MRQRLIGETEVSEIGLGEMPLSVEGRPDDRQAGGTIHAALDAGITVIETADAYHIGLDGVGHGEELVARALRSYGPHAGVLVATKGGHVRGPGDGPWALDGTRGHLRRAREESLRRLGTDRIDLYQHHRPDRDVLYEESVGALAELAGEWKIRYTGISNAGPDQIRVARRILGDRLVVVQNQLSPYFPSSLPELALCDELGLTFLAWSPLGGVRESGRRRSRLPGVRRGRRGDRRRQSPGDPGLAAVALAPAHPDPGVPAGGDRPQRRRRSGSRAVGASDRPSHASSQTLDTTDVTALGSGH